MVKLFVKITRRQVTLAMFKNEIQIFATYQILKNSKYRKTQSQMLLPTKSEEEHTARNIKGKSILKISYNKILKKSGK
jgi:hypothetical protein